jgi:hypothetical protein
LKTPERALLAVSLLALLVMGLAVATRFAQRDTRPAEGPAVAPDAGEVALDAARGAEEDPPSPEEGPRIHVLELGSPGGTSGRASTPSHDAASERGRSPATLRELPRGGAQVVFAVQDASGRALRDVSVLLKSLDPGGGAERAVTGSGGEARFLDLAPGRYAYLAQAPGRPERASASLQLEPAEHKRLTLRLAGSGLSIAGTARNLRGEPLAGIGVSAVRHRFASSVSEGGARDASSRSVRTDASGAFTFGGLEQGEYDLLTRATARYPSVKAVVQAGATSVDLILAEGRRVHGTVTNPRGEPLARVWVGLDARRDRFAYTDATGSYALQLDSDSAASDPTVRFYLRGYEEERLALPAPEGGVEGGRLDVELRTVEDAARVAGVLESERGEPIAGATIVLGSKALGTHYQTVSDSNGDFSVPDVKIGQGYSLRVLPDGSYLDFTQHGIEVPEDGLSLEISLESLSTGRLVGRMVDAEGNRVPGFRLWVVSSAATRSAVPISSDERGYFELAEAPAGSLSFDTRSSPRLAVSGVLLPADGEREVILVLDWGDQELIGEVVGERGEPIAGAEVSLSWSHANGDIRSRSQRATRTNASGSFRFAQLGPGEHRLDVRAAGYRAVQEQHEVGRHAADVQVRLESAVR